MNYKKRPDIALCAAAIALTAGCTNMVTIRSDPPGAQCWIGERYVGTTPLDTDVTSWALRKCPDIVLKKDGYSDYRGVLRKKKQWYVWIDWLCVYAYFFNSALVSGDYTFELQPVP